MHLKLDLCDLEASTFLTLLVCSIVLGSGVGDGRVREWENTGQNPNEEKPLKSIRTQKRGMAGDKSPPDCKRWAPTEQAFTLVQSAGGTEDVQAQAVSFSPSSTSPPHPCGRQLVGLRMLPGSALFASSPCSAWSLWLLALSRHWLWINYFFGQFFRVQLSE